MVEGRIKVYNYQSSAEDRRVDQRTFRDILRCLEALMCAATEGQIGDNTLKPEALVQLRTYCRDHAKAKLDPQLFRPLLHMPSFQAGFLIGDHLFDAGWKGAIQNNEALKISDPDIRAIIARSKPVVHIRHDFNGLEKSSKLDFTKACLNALEHQALPVKGDKGLLRTEDKRLKTEALVQLHAHCINPALYLDPVVFKPIIHIRNSSNPRLNGAAIGNFLFGEDWQEKIKAGESLRIVDPEVQQIIANATPTVTVECKYPHDHTDPISQKIVKKWSDAEKNRFHDHTHVLPESGEGGPPPARPGDWFTFRFEQGRQTPRIRIDKSQLAR